MSRCLSECKGAVIGLLRNEPSTRDSDQLLYVRYCENALGRKLSELREVMLHRSDIPQMESISRARRKAQAEDETLRATRFVKAVRDARQEEFKKFARS